MRARGLLGNVATRLVEEDTERLCEELRHADEGHPARVEVARGGEGEALGRERLGDVLGAVLIDEAEVSRWLV